MHVYRSYAFIPFNRQIKAGYNRISWKRWGRNNKKTKHHNKQTTLQQIDWVDWKLWLFNMHIHNKHFIAGAPWTYKNTSIIKLYHAIFLNWISIQNLAFDRKINKIIYQLQLQTKNEIASIWTVRKLLKCHD